MPFLWGDPASHFGKENDAVYGRTSGYALSVVNNSMLTDYPSGLDAIPPNP